eukprot:2695561-Heterocapsa_arctica.AAC.1
MPSIRQHRQRAAGTPRAYTSPKRSTATSLTSSSRPGAHGIPRKTRQTTLRPLPTRIPERTPPRTLLPRNAPE